MLCNFTFPVCPSWPKNVFYCCKQNRMNFYHEFLTTCILVMKASYQIESMGFFFFLWNENHQILCSFWWHCSTMQKKFYHMQKLLVGFVFIFYLGKNIKTTVGFTININSNNIYTYGINKYISENLIHYCLKKVPMHNLKKCWEIIDELYFYVQCRSERKIIATTFKHVIIIMILSHLLS